MIERVHELEQAAEADLAAVGDARSLELFRIKHLGTKGSLKALMAMMKDVPPPDKPAFGAAANALRRKIEAAFEARKAELGQGAAGAVSPGASGSAAVDMTLPGTPPTMGRTHVITQTIDELVEVFGRMGFDVATGPELEDEWHNFIALNIPESHPARDPLDNFYVEPPEIFGGPRGSKGTMLRSQTSTIQIRVMEKTPPPLRVVAVGRVYRPDEHDATHYSMFHQVEGLYVDRKVSMVDLKTTLVQFAHAMFGPAAEIRLRPSYFPFTEPSAELDVKMTVRGVEKWVELGGCGMVDPAVFEHVGYDPEVWTGFAFGLGIERLAMRKYAIGDIRWLFENDLRFLRQF